MKNTISKLILHNGLDLTLMLGSAGLLMGLGFLTIDRYNPNYVLVYQIFDFKVWAAIFLAYGIGKFILVFIDTLRYRALHLTLSVIGAWAWTYLFFSFIFFDPTHLSPAELLIVVFIGSELWSMTYILYLFFKERK